MAAPKRRGATEREQALAEVARGYLQGELQSSIAARLGVSGPQVTYDLAILRKRWQQSALADMTEAKGRELAKLDELERTYYDAWQRSISERTITSTKKRGETAEASLRREQRDGNPAFLDGVLKCVQQRCRIWGIEGPQKIALTDPTGEREYRSITDGDIDREIARVLAALGDAALGLAPGGTPLSLAPPREAEPASS